MLSGPGRLHSGRHLRPGAERRTSSGSDPSCEPSARHPGHDASLSCIYSNWDIEIRQKSQTSESERRQHGLPKSYPFQISITWPDGTEEILSS